MSLDELRRATRNAVLGPSGMLDRSIRERVAAGDPPSDLDVLVRKIREHAYRVSDADVDALRARYREDQIFEVIIAAALGAAEYRLNRALAAVENA